MVLLCLKNIHHVILRKFEPKSVFFFMMAEAFFMLSVKTGLQSVGVSLNVIPGNQRVMRRVPSNVWDIISNEGVYHH